MSDVLSFNPNRALTANIGAAAAAKAYFYDAGTTNLKTVYADADLQTAHPSPLLADASGVFAQVFTDGVACKVVVQTAAGATLYTLDPAPTDRVSGFAPGGGTFFDDVTLLLADTELTYSAGPYQVVAGDILQTRSENFSYEVAASGASDQHVTTAGGVKLYVLPGSDGSVNVAAFGADGVGTETAQFEAAATVAAASGSGVVVIPFASFTVSTAGANASNCAVVGRNTTVTGFFKNARSLDGLTIGGIRQGRREYHPVIPLDDTMKMLLRVGTNEYNFYVQSQRGSYLLVTLKNNVTTTGDSLATTTADQTQWRVNDFLRCVEVLTGYLTPSSSNGTWTSLGLTTGVPAYTSGTIYNYSRSTTIGAWREYTITVPEDGFFSITFLRSSGASTDVDVSVDGVVIDAAINTQDATTRRWTKIYRTVPGSRVIRIENKTAGSTGLNIVGLNFSPLKTQRPDVSLDTFGHYRNSANIDPVTNNSANDYAIWDEDAGKWGGSYHGGETSFTEAFLVGGSAVSLSTGQFAVGREIEVVQTSTINWSAFGGSTLGVETRHLLCAGGYALTCVFTGSVRARSFFTTLYGVSTNYTRLSSPQNVDISALADGARYPLPLTSSVEFAASTGERVRLMHSAYDYSSLKEGGPQVWRVVGSYHKYYNALVSGGEMVCGPVSSVLVVQA